MLPSLRRKLEALLERREELERLLADPGVVADNDRFRGLSREFAQLEPVAVGLAAETQARNDLAAAEALRGDPEMRELAEEEIAEATASFRRRRQRGGRSNRTVSSGKCVGPAFACRARRRRSGVAAGR